MQQKRGPDSFEELSGFGGIEDEGSRDPWRLELGKHIVIQSEYDNKE